MRERMSVPSPIVEARCSDGPKQSLSRLLQPSYGADRLPDKFFPRKHTQLVLYPFQSAEVS